MTWPPDAPTDNMVPAKQAGAATCPLLDHYRHTLAVLLAACSTQAARWPCPLIAPGLPKRLASLSVGDVVVRGRAQGPVSELYGRPCMEHRLDPLDYLSSYGSRWRCLQAVSLPQLDLVDPVLQAKSHYYRARAAVEVGRYHDAQTSGRVRLDLYRASPRAGLGFAFMLVLPQWAFGDRPRPAEALEPHPPPTPCPGRLMR